MNRNQFATKPQCYGETSTGQRCTRTKLNETGYCFQHRNQFVDEQQDEQRPQKLQRQDATFLPPSPGPKGKQEEDPISSSSSSSSSLLSSEEEEEIPRPRPPTPPSPMPLDQDDEEAEEEEEEEHESSSSDDDDDEPLAAVPQAAGAALVLTQCAAIAKSTGVQCRKLVSFADQQYCPAHGGTQKAPLQPLMPQCAAIANSTRRQCLRNVSVAGETRCPAHGGLSKKQVQENGGVIPAPQPPIALLQPVHQAPNDGVVVVPWPVIHDKSIRFLMQEHGETPCHQCNLDDQPCAPLAVVLWLQDLAKRCARAHLVQPTPIILQAWLQGEPRNHHHARFELILVASRMFRSKNTRWLLAALDDSFEDDDEHEQKHLSDDEHQL